MRTSFAIGRYSASAPTEGDVLAFPHWAFLAGSRRGVLFCHGAEGSGVQVVDPTVGYQPVVTALAESGFPLVAPDLGSVQSTSDVWGNDTGMSRMNDAFTWLTNPAGGGAKTDKVILVGGSMGGLMAFNWAKRNPGKVQAIAVIIPVLDLQDVFVNNRSGLAAQITAAYGGAPDYPTRSPLLLASALNGIPTAIWYATNDPVNIDPTVPGTVVGAIGGGSAAYSMGAVGHTFSAVDPGHVLEFVGANQ